MQITASFLLFALGVYAAATPQHRRHQQFHEKKAVGDIVTATIDGQVVHWVNEYAGPTATAQADGASPAATEATTEATATSATTSGDTSASSSSSSQSSAGNAGSVSEYTSFCSNSKRATVDEIGYKGNTGSGTWGCNFQLVESSIADEYDYTMKFTSAKDTQSCVCWNKIGPDGGVNGAFGYTAVSFNVAEGSEQYVAVDSNSQGGCACAVGEVPKTTYGQWGATWVEFDFGNTSNDNYSGGDISALVPQEYGMEVQGMSVATEDGSQSSSLTPGATVNHLAYVKGMEADDGVGINLAPGKVRFNVVAGYTG